MSVVVVVTGRKRSIVRLLRDHKSYTNVDFLSNSAPKFFGIPSKVSLRGEFQFHHCAQVVSSLQVLITNARRKLQQARDELAHVRLSIIGQSKRKKRLLQIRGVVLDFQDIAQLERKLRGDLEEDRYTDALGCLKELLSLLSKKNLEVYPAVNNLAGKRGQLAGLIRKKIFEDVRGVLFSGRQSEQNFDSPGGVVLGRRGEEKPGPHGNKNGGPSSTTPPNGAALPRTCYLDDSKYEKLLAAADMLAAVDPNAATGVKTSAGERIMTFFFDAVASITRQSLLACAGPGVTGSGSSLSDDGVISEALKMVAPDDFVPCMTALFEHLTDLLHRHFYLTRWHRRRVKLAEGPVKPDRPVPVPVRTWGRSGLTGSGDGDGGPVPIRRDSVVPGDGGGPPLSSSEGDTKSTRMAETGSSSDERVAGETTSTVEQIAPTTLSPASRDLVRTIHDVWADLSSNKKVLWDRVQYQVSQLLISWRFEKLPENMFLHCVYLTHLLIEEGDLFMADFSTRSGAAATTGAPPNRSSLPLRNTLKTKCHDYFLNFHSTSWMSVHSILTHDSWQRMPISKMAINLKTSPRLLKLRKPGGYASLKKAWNFYRGLEVLDEAHEAGSNAWVFVNPFTYYNADEEMLKEPLLKEPATPKEYAAGKDVGPVVANATVQVQLGLVLAISVQVQLGAQDTLTD